MSKTVHCVFCDKELRAGLFGVTDFSLTIGEQLVPCCEECCIKWKTTVKRVNKRLARKIYNYRKATKVKPDGKMLAQMLLRYVREERAAVLAHPVGPECKSVQYYKYTDDGLFSVEEIDRTALVSERKRIKKANKAEDVLRDQYEIVPTKGEAFFTKDDISKIEFRLTEGIEQSLFTGVYTFEVRFNDEKTITYKPCITRFEVYGAGLLPFLKRRNARYICEHILKRLQMKIGSDLPITYVRKFR